jgi:hypothetical protein
MASTYSVTRDDIITSALRKLGVIEPSEVPDSVTITNSAMTLNLMIKQFSTEGLKLWKNSELIIPLVSGKTQYQLGDSNSVTYYDTQAPTTAITDRPLKAIQGFYRNKSVTPYIDTPCLILSKQEYNVLGSKFSTGVTNSFFYDVKSTYGLLYLYLTPDLSAATNLEFHMVVQLPLNDISTSSSIPDFPNEWFNCLVWNLADQLALEYGVPLNYRQEIAMRANTYREALNSWDVDYASTYFQPDMRNTNSGSYSR